MGDADGKERELARQNGVWPRCNTLGGGKGWDGTEALQCNCSTTGASIYIYGQIRLADLVGQIMCVCTEIGNTATLLQGRRLFSAHTDSARGPGGQRRNDPGCHCDRCWPLLQAEGKDGPGQESVAASGLVAVAVAVAGKVAVVAVARRFACSGRYVMVQTGKPVGLWRAGAGRKQKLPGEKEGGKRPKKERGRSTQKEAIWADRRGFPKGKVKNFLKGEGYFYHESGRTRSGGEEERRLGEGKAEQARETETVSEFGKIQKT